MSREVNRVKISELSRTTGVSVPTVKFYLREGLLPPGTATTAPNQADYGQAHVHRLRLIRVLTHLGRLSVASTRALLTAVDDPNLPIHDVLSVTQKAISPVAAEDVPADVRTARADVDRYLKKLRWAVPRDAPARDALADALLALRQLGRDVDTSVFDRYAELADDLARAEVATVPGRAADREQIVEAMVVGTVVFEAALVALRRLAHARHSARRFRAGLNADDHAPVGQQ
jgi:DNA-binding transcriptional MerR regulator